MPITSNVSLTNTFDQWRLKTNETIEFYNQLELANINFISNTSNTIQFNGSNTLNVRMGNTIHITCNAVPITGGSITGNLAISSNLSVGGNLTIGTTGIRANGMVVLGTTILYANGMISVGSLANTIIHANGQINALG